MINNKSSQFVPLTTGVPQGSTLGPILIPIYSNDIVKSSSVLKFTLLTDDTNITLSGTDTGSLNQIVNLELKFITK